MRNLIRLVGLACLILLLTGNEIKSQYKVSLGIQGGATASFFQMNPHDPNLYPGTSFFLSNFGGRLAWQFLNEHTFLDFDFHLVDHFLRFKFPGDILGGAPRMAEFTNFGLGIRRRIDLVRNRLFISPICGFQIGIVDPKSGGGSSGINGPQGAFRFSYQLPFQRDKIGGFVFGGILVECQFTNGMVLSLRASFHQGLSKIVDGDVSYHFNNDPPTTLRFFTRGSHLPVQLGLSYPISRIWEGKKEIE